MDRQTSYEYHTNIRTTMYILQADNPQDSVVAFGKGKLQGFYSQNSLVVCTNRGSTTSKL